MKITLTEDLGLTGFRRDNQKPPTTFEVSADMEGVFVQLNNERVELSKHQARVLATFLMSVCG